MTRLARAIADSGRSLPALARAASIPLDRITVLAAGDAQPTYGELRALAKALKRTVVDLSNTDETQPAGRAEILFRTVMNQVPAASQVSSKIDQLIAFHAPSEERVSWISHMPKTHRTRDDAENAAIAFRRHYYKNDQLGPIVDLPDVLDDLGVIQFIINGERIEGASSIVDGVPFVFVSPRFPPRMLFTLGHELGHLIVHQDADFAAADEDMTENQAKGSQGKDEERYCHWFASSLLLPANGLGLALKRFRENNGITKDELGDVEILFLSHLFGVSFFAAANRCEELTLIPRGAALSLYQTLSEDYKNPEARAAEVGFPQRERLRFPDIPQVLVGRVLQAIKKGEVSIGKAASLLNVSLRDLMAKNVDTPPS